MAVVERIGFEVGGERLVGDLHLPEGGGPHPGVVVGGPMTSVKEQVTGTYAAALAGRGVAALAIDHRGFGASGGTPRQYERADLKIADLRAALDRLAASPAVDAGRIGAVGVCLGAGYVLAAAAGHARVRAIGAVAGYYRDPAAMRAQDPAGFDARVEQGRRAREHYERTGEVETVPAVALEGDAAMTTADTYDYYANRAAVPSYVNRFAVMSREHFLPFDVQAVAPATRAPLLMIHSEKALSPHWARKFQAAAPGAGPIHWMESKGQTDFYDDPTLVDRAAGLLREHLIAAWRS